MISERRKKRISVRLLICLLTALLIVPLWAFAAYGDDIEAVNTSGSLNRAPAVDPITESDGFTAVLYNNKNGLPTSDANAVAQTDDGFIWVGSYAGLIRYDGNNFERLDSTTGIANVRCLYVDSKERLWIGTNDSGVFLMTKGSLRKWDRSDGLRSVSIRAITEDDKGLIYVAGAAGGVATINSGLELTLLEDERLDGQSVPELRRGSNGLIFGCTQDGDIFTLRNGEVLTWLSRDACRIKDVHCILPDPEHPDLVYVGTSASQVMHGSYKDNFASLYTADISPLSSVNSMEYIDGRIWVCTGNGVGRLSEDGTGVLRNVPLNNTVEHMMTDFSGNLWFVSSHQGLMKVVPNQFSDLFERFDLDPVVVNSTCLYDDQLFIGTDTGLIVIEGEKKLESLPVTRAMTATGKALEADDLLSMLDGVRIRAITRDSKGRLWIPAWRRYGVLRYDHGEVVAFGRDEGLFSDSVRMVYECEDGSFLVANTGGLSVIKGSRVKKSYGAEAGIVNGEILTVTEGFNHEYILGSDGDGIYIITDEGTKRLGTEDGLRSEIILRIKRSSYQDIYWIVTGNSIAYMTLDYKITTVKNFPYPNNYDLYENSSGSLWVLSSSGVYIVSVDEMLANGKIDPVFFGVRSGLPYVATANAVSELSAGGDLYISSSAGVVKVNVDQPFENLSRFKITLPYIEADGERCYQDTSGRFILPANARKVTIYPYVFNYALVDPQVTYRLQGFDPADTTVSRSKLGPVDYTNLKIGSYHFMITVRDPIGHTEQNAVFSITKGKEMSSGTIGTIIMDCSSLLMMAGLLIFMTRYRTRGRLQDKMFLGLILSNTALTAGELISFSLEYFTFPGVKALMYFGNTLFYIMLVFFPYLLLVYFDYSRDHNRQRERRMKLVYAIPFVFFFIVMIINLKTGWIFSISRENAFVAGPHRMTLLLLIPVWLYLLLSLVNIYIVEKRMVLPGVLLIAARLCWELWFQSISSTSFIFTLFLVCMHLFYMNRQYEEVTES